VVFVSDRGGSFGVWRQRVREGKPAGEPVLLKAHAGRVLSLGMTAQGGYFFGLRSGATDVRVAEIDLAAGKLTASPQPAAPRLEGVTSSPAWSADGRKLAFLVRLANENFGQESRGVGIAELFSSRVQLLTPKLAYLGKLEWAPDGKSLLVSGSDRQSRRGLYRVDAASGEASPVIQERSSTFRGLEGVWFAKGESVLYATAGEESAEIRERSLARAAETAVFRVEPGAAISHLALAPGGRWLAFVTGSGAIGSRDEVRVLDLQPRQERTIASLPHANVLGLQWTPDAKAVLVSTPGNPTAALWRAPLDGRKPERLEIRLDRRDGVSLHPDGKRVAFTTGHTGSEIWVMDLH
jgi:Tol biopolymer transport system component